MTRNEIAAIWIPSIAYCLWRMFKRYKQASHDGIVGVTPNMEIWIVLLLAPLLTLVDIVVTWIMMMSRYYKTRKNK